MSLYQFIKIHTRKKQHCRLSTIFSKNSTKKIKGLCLFIKRNKKTEKHVTIISL